MFSLGVYCYFGLQPGLRAQDEEHFVCGYTGQHEINGNGRDNDGDGNRDYIWTDCDTIRTALISILPAPRADNWSLFHESLQNVADQTDIVAIENVKHVQMDWTEMAGWLQEKLKTENIHPIFHSLDYKNMPPALADSLRNIIDEHGPDAIYLELPSDMPGNNYAL
jgi:hypothetical protein